MFLRNSLFEFFFGNVNVPPKNKICWHLKCFFFKSSSQELTMADLVEDSEKNLAKTPEIETTEKPWQCLLTQIRQKIKHCQTYSRPSFDCFCWNNNCNQNFIGWSQFSINECQKHHHNTCFALYTYLILRAPNIP